MTRANIPDSKKQRIRQTADNRCEYCLSHQDYASSAFEVEHIIPIAKGGSDDETNLCLSCASCNSRKGAKLLGIDPDFGDSSRFYNPRTDIWAEHFNWSDDKLEIYGITAIGRATVKEFKLNNPRMITARKNWREGRWRPPE